MFLGSEELAALTGRRRSDAQARVLIAMGIEHRVRPDGSIAVMTAHVERLFGAMLTVPKRREKALEPDWS